MNTTTMQLKIQRGRFAQHLAAAVAGILPVVFGAFKLPEARVLSAAESASREAAEVRRMAQTYVRTDPGFAADLYAAAARHESMEG